MEILCGVEKITLSNNFSFEGFSVKTSESGKTMLGPLASAPYTCAFTEAVRVPKDVSVLSATITFITKYDSRWPWPFNQRSQSESDFFTLNTQTTPPQ
jgi:hypothetical protein